MSNRTYSRVTHFALDEITRALKTLAGETDHQFWPDGISITDEQIFDTGAIYGPSQLTDIYLLALAVENDGRFVTFDRRISRLAVPSAQSDNLVILSTG